MLRMNALLVASAAAVLLGAVPAHADSVGASASSTYTQVGTGWLVVTTCTATGSAGAVITSVDCTVNGVTATGHAPGSTAVVVRPDAISGSLFTVCVQGRATFYPSLTTVSSPLHCSSTSL
ncbi:MAG: hypothetical protein QOE45_3334 [Frankiaceae bacterium]|jgi:hypothetical protein|nr:hypothetical protein [Frankiaceae bacterium]